MSIIRALATLVTYILRPRTEFLVQNSPSSDVSELQSPKLSVEAQNEKYTKLSRRDMGAHQGRRAPLVDNVFVFVFVS